VGGDKRLIVKTFNNILTLAVTGIQVTVEHHSTQASLESWVVQYLCKIKIINKITWKLTMPFYHPIFFGEILVSQQMI